MNIGIIAEDDSDVAVISQLTLALLSPQPVGFKKFVGDGCGKLRRKCSPWALNSVKQGCSWIVVLHDLDNYNEEELRRNLEEVIAPAKPKSFIVLIPKREIEAWLLYDADAIACAFNEKKPPKLPGNPENIEDPKAHLDHLVWKKYRKRYVHTIHNLTIAKLVKVNLLKKSRSFSPHFAFTAALRLTLEKSKG